MEVDAESTERDADPRAALAQALQQRLDERDTYAEQIPAVVLRVEDERALVFASDLGIGEVQLTDSRWARLYVSVDERGPRIRQMSDVLQVGDIVRVNPRQVAGAGSAPTWLLTQLPDIQGALIAMDPQNGAVRALVGGYDFYRNQYNYALQAQRQPGSGFKPFVYSSALSRGITPADIFLDAPLVFEDANLESQYRPENDNNRYNGPTRLRQALYRSINLVSMRVLLEVGAGRVLEDVKKFGFDMTSFPRNTQLALGGGTMTVAPIDMVRAYGVLANGGYLVEPYIVDRLLDQSGNVLYATNPATVCKDCEAAEEKPDTVADSDAGSTSQEIATGVSVDGGTDPSPSTWLRTTVLESMLNAQTATPTQQAEVLAEQVLDERNAYVMQSMLRDVIKLGTGRRARTLNRNDLAGKTGTTNDASDTWFNGFNHALVASVWVGFKDQQPLGRNAYGSNVPLPIWIDFMEEALADVPEMPLLQPPGVVTLRVDKATGLPTSVADSTTVSEVFLAEFAPDASSLMSGEQRQTEDIRSVDLF